MWFCVYVLLSVYFIKKSKRPHSLLVYLHNNPKGMLEEHLKKFVNHLPPFFQFTNFSCVFPKSYVNFCTRRLIHRKCSLLLKYFLVSSGQ